MKKKGKRIKVFLMLALILGITVGYATLTTTLNITGNSEIKNAKWDIHFTNLVVDETSVEASTPATIDPNKTTVNYVVNLVKSGDSYSFSVDVENAGTIDGMISTISNTGLITEQQKYLDYSITYSDGTELKAKDGLKAGTKRNIKVKVKYKDNINYVDLPQEDKTINVNFAVEYVQADDTVVMPIAKVCKRATTLHTVECTRTDSDYGCSGAGYTANGSKGTTTITYGNLGTNGTLNSGDAFDCDVNNDGTYDPVTERFYYVSPAYKDGTYSEKYVTLIYYNNTKDGIADNTSTFAYDSSNENYHGPRTAYVNLPSVSQWSNPSLVANMNRQIRTETGTTSTDGGAIESFTYTGKAARFLAAQEVNKACNIIVGSRNVGELDSCNYLMENTNYSTSGFTYGYWLESPLVSSFSIVWYVIGSNRHANNVDADFFYNYGARPAIEVPKSKISY